MVVVMQVAAAETGGADLYLEFVRFGGWERARFLYIWLDVFVI